MTQLATDVILSACREAWGAGYQTAVDTLRGLAAEFDDENVKAAIDVLAKTLESVKPSLQDVTNDSS